MNIKIPAAPEPIMEKIVEECENVDAGYETALMTIQKLRNDIATAITKVFDHGYSKESVSDLSLELQYGTAEKSLANGKVPVLRMGNIQNGIIDWNDLVYSNNEDDIAKYALKNDVLFNRTNSPEHVGKVGLYRGERPAIFAGYLIRIKYKPERINPVYLAYILNSREMREYGFSVMSKSINQANIGGGTLAKYKIPVPPMPVQNKLAEKLEKLEAEIATANKIIADASVKKAAILDKYLK